MVNVYKGKRLPKKLFSSSKGAELWRVNNGLEMGVDIKREPLH